MTKKIPDGCGMCNRSYKKDHKCVNKPYTRTELFNLIKARKKKKK